jgi:hypothetical protein
MAGAVTLTAIHQGARAVSDAAPRMDVVGMRALAGGRKDLDTDADQQHRGLYLATLAGDLISNSAYYSLATTWTRGALLGLAAGVGALVLPQRMGLGTPPHSELLSNRIMTVAWYTLGGLAAACTAQWLAHRHAESAPQMYGGF